MKATLQAKRTALSAYINARNTLLGAFDAKKITKEQYQTLENEAYQKMRENFN